MVTNLWPQTQSPATIKKDSSEIAVSVLEILKSQVLKHPSDWRWALLLARAEHEEGDREAAVRTLRPLQRLHAYTPIGLRWSPYGLCSRKKPTMALSQSSI